MEEDTSNKDQSLTGPEYIAAKEAAALQGKTYNPTLGFEPVKSAGRNVFNIDWGDVAPRASLAWTPSFDSGFLHRMTGNRKTVIRGGFGIGYDRINTGQSGIIPMLGVGFAQTIRDRKSTRLNSSHSQISYAVFCLKKKK